MQNILLTTFNEPPFSKINTDDFEPAFEAAIQQAKSDIDAIVNQDSAPTFANTLEAISFSGMTLDRVSSIFFNLHSAETNDEIQQIAQRVAPKLSAFNNDIILNEKLFKRVQSVYEQRNELDLSPEQYTSLEKTYRNFVRNGALLQENDKEKLREIDAELSIKSLQFAENVLSETQDYRLHITDKNDLKRSEEHTSELQSRPHLVCRLLLEKKNKQ